jgi:N-acetylmuramoyl-L-alanine amidase
MRFCWTGIAPARHCGRVSVLLALLSWWFMGVPAFAASAVERVDVRRDRVVVHVSQPAATASGFVAGADDGTATGPAARSGGARIVLDLARPAIVSDGRLGSEGRDLTLQLRTADAAAFTQAAAERRLRFLPPFSWLGTTTPREGSTVAMAVPPARRTLSLPRIYGSDDSRPLVVIDAGHGGHDPGALGPNGLREKDVTLRIAQAIKDELLRSGRVRVALTRGDDRYLILQERYGVARKLGADLFISIHCDSVGEGNATGASVYTLSEVASDKQAARLAARENKSDIIAGVDLADAAADVTSILIDLTQRETMNSSAQFARLLGREASPLMPFKPNFHRMASLMVLKAPDVPSILFETGYISNPTDAAFISSADGRGRIAQGVRRAVEAYFARRLNSQGTGAIAAR